MDIKKIISGGQTGVDRAALDAALELNFACGGWCPNGRLAEDGYIPKHYPLQETESAEYTERTCLNVQESDGTLIIAFGVLTGGTAYTLKCAKNLHKPYFLLQAQAEQIPMTEFWDWIKTKNITTLNVAGPRESQQAGMIYQKAKSVLLALLSPAC